MGQRGYVDSAEAQPGGDREGNCRGVSATLVFDGASEAGRFDEGSGGGFDGGGEQPGEGIPDGVSETFFGAGRITDEPGGGTVSNDIVYRAGGGGIVAADRVRERGEFAAGASDDKREGVCDSIGAGREPVETGPATAGGERDPGDWRGGGGDAAGVGRPEIAGSADAAENHPGGSGDPTEYAGAAVHAGSGDHDGAGIWTGAGAEGGAEGY